MYLGIYITAEGLAAVLHRLGCWAAESEDLGSTPAAVVVFLNGVRNKNARAPRFQLNVGGSQVV